MGENRFFISGCQRSGTTLLRLVLECHPTVYVHDELASYKALAGRRFDLPPGKDVVGFKVPRWAECLADELAWDDGIAEAAERPWRDEPLVFVYRDVRDTIASMRKLRMTADESWLEFCAKPILRAKFERTPLGLKFAAEWDAVRAAGEPGVLVGALYWKYKNAALFDYLAAGRPVLPLRYEDLVADPEPHLRRVCRFLDVGWDSRLLMHPALEHTEVFHNGTVMGNTDPKRAIDTASVGQWREWLTGDEEEAVMEIAGEMNGRLAKLGRRGWLRRLTGA